MRSVKGLAILACNFLHATQVAAIFIANRVPVGAPPTQRPGRDFCKLSSKVSL